MLNKTTWKSLLKEATKGDAKAQCDVAEYYSYGYRTKANKIIVKQNFHSAFSCIIKPQMLDILKL